MVKTISGQKLESIFKWRLYRFDGQKEYPIGDWVEHSYIGKPVNKAQNNFNKHLVTYGQYNIQAQLDSKGKGNSGLRVIATFSVLERDKIVPYYVVGFFSLIIGAGLTFLIQYIVNMLSSNSG